LSLVLKTFKILFLKQMPPKKPSTKKTPAKKLALNKSLGELQISSNQPELGYLYGRGSIGARFYKTVG
jgi:hypothetical protein